jgi:GNAT superfamily N-acetyltransferase
VPEDILISTGRPDRAEVLQLYGAVGWTAYTRDPDRLVEAIVRSHTVFCARTPTGRLVGLARTVSDGAVICYLQDILVDPAWHRRGVGRRLLEAVLEHYRDVRQFVLLTDDDDAQRALYRAAGLVRSNDLGLQAYVRPPAAG